MCPAVCTHHYDIKVNSSQELLKATENLQNCTTIEIVAQEVELTQPLNFSGRYNRSLLDITVTGSSSNNTIIKCKGMKILFSRISWLTISHVSFINCSNRNRSVRDSQAGVQIVECSNISLENILVSEGTGLMLLHAKDTINIINSQFLNNSDLQPAGGLQIFASHNALYTVAHCKFKQNVVDCSNSNKSGAGIIVLFEGADVSNNIVSFYNCTIFNNTAKWGGGMAVYFFRCGRNNAVHIAKCTFDGNNAAGGGGGLDIGYLSQNGIFPQLNNNTVTVRDTQFLSNKANFGGGVTMFSNYSTQHSNKAVFFNGCLFQGNKATFSPAVNIAPSSHTKQAFDSKYLLMPKFCNCDFKGNTILKETRNITEYISSGVFLATTATVYFCGTIQFIGNWNTALYLSSSTAIFDTNSSVLFEGNRGLVGGALVLYGFSAIFVNTDSTFNFTNNSASAHGGAIYYYSYDQHNYFPSALCFIQYNGNASVHTKDRNINLYFNDNEANVGRAIFASSLHPCLRACDGEGQNLTHALECQATYHYNTSDISTVGTELLPKNLSPTPPGKRFLIDFTTKDELGHPVKGEYVILPARNYPFQYFISNTKSTFKLYGKENSNGSITIQTADSLYSNQFRIHYELGACPPGFHNIDNTSCVCHTATNIECDKTTMIAYVLAGYWAGYLDMHNYTTCDFPSKDCAFYTSLCPNSHCHYQNMAALPKYELPTEGVLEHFMCGQNRIGILCRDCVDGTAFQYHAINFTCGDTRTCKYGILLYVLSELVPVTILFVVILLFDIKLTSGSLNGFILTVQILQLVQYGEYRFFQQTEAQKFSVLIFELLYGLLNLDLFHSDIFSFCLFKNANILDGIAIKYVTVAYAFILVVFLALVMNYCYCGKCCRKVYRKRRSSAVNAVCAFIVISYAQCAHTTFNILTPLHLYSDRDAVVYTYYGGILFFSNTHLLYAIPAILILASLVCLLPLVLLVYPLYYNVHKFRSTGKSTCIKLLHPILENFSSCFKDNHRYFAGVYLLYRLLPSIAYSYTFTFKQYYILMELIFIVMLLIHGIAQPYANQWHNFLDGLLYAVLTLANGFTLVGFIMLITEEATVVYSWFQAGFYVFPPFIIAVYLSVKFYVQLKRNQEKTESVQMQNN